MSSGKLKASVSLFLLMLVIPWADCWAAPFGFEYGMSKEQIIKLLGSESLVKVDGDTYQFSKAPKPNDAFEFYMLTISPEKGLLKVAAVSKDIDTSVYGEELVRQFEEIDGALSKTYGEGETYDFLKAGSIWNKDRQWMMSLLSGERELASAWRFLIPTDHVTVILLQARALSPERGYFFVSYEFEGFKQYIEADKGKKPAVF